jgi:hypothetical protein
VQGRSDKIRQLQAQAVGNGPPQEAGANWSTITSY